MLVGWAINARNRNGLAWPRFQGHEVIVFHLWDPWERDLPLEGHYRFHDLETDEMLLTQAESVRGSRSTDHLARTRSPTNWLTSQASTPLAIAAVDTCDWDLR